MTWAWSSHATSPASATSTRRRRCRARCRSGRTRRRRCRTACTRSSCPAPRSPRHATRRSWLYRIRPAALHGAFAPCAHPHFHNRFEELPTPPDQMRWSPFPLPDAPADFVDGIFTIAGNGSAAAQAGCGLYVYACNRPMQDRFFYDADGELVIVPQQGRLRIATELGVLEIEPQQIALVPRGLRFRVELPDGTARGYVGE